MKTTLLLLLVACTMATAQTPAPAPPPTPNYEEVREALRRAISNSSNVSLPPSMVSNRVITVPDEVLMDPTLGAPSSATNTTGVPDTRRPLRTPTATAADAATNPPAATVTAPATDTTTPPADTADAPVAPVTTSPSPAATAAATPAVAPGGPPGTAPASDPTAPAPIPSPTVSIPPSVAARPAAGEEILPAGTINFPAVDVNQVLAVYAELVGKTLLRPATLPAPLITLKTQTPLTKREAIQAFETVLAMNGIAMVPIGDKFVKVIPNTEAFSAGGRLSSKSDPDEMPDSGQYVSEIVQIHYAKPSEMVAVLQPFSKIPNSILPVDSSQILVIRDYTENVKRMLEMIKKVDVQVQSEFVSEVIPIRYALASEIANALNSLSTGGGGGGGTSVGRQTTGGRTGGAGTTGYRPPGQTGLGGQQQGGLNQPFGTGGQLGTQQGAGGAGQPTFTDRLQQIIRRASTSGDLQILGQNKIIADERMNALLVFATRPDMDTITNIVAKLDVVLAQVLIETIILDVSADNSFNFGVSAVQKPIDFTPSFTGAGGANANKFFDFAGSSNTNVFGDLLGSGLKYFGKVNENYLVSLEAMATDGRAKVIQKPRIQTSHATPASLFIGRTVPYVTSTYYGGGFGGGPSSSYQQLRVGIGLNVTPFINQDGLVVMKIDESIDEIAGSTFIEGVGDVPNTTSRTLSGEVAVRDRETIVLGGFIRNSDSTSRGGVPFLMNIPLLGYLFRSTGDKKERSELLVLMRPTVLRTPELAALEVPIQKREMPGILQAERDYQKQLKREATKLPPPSEPLFSQPPPAAPPQ